MKLKKMFALTLAAVMMMVTLTACMPLDMAAALFGWFFGGGSSSASRGNGVNLVESKELKSQLMTYFGLNEADVITDKSRKALEEAVGKLDGATMMNADKTELNTAGQKALNEVAKSQLLLNREMCIDVMELSPARVAAAEASPAIPGSRKLYWARYIAYGNGGMFGVGGMPAETSLRTYDSDLYSYPAVKGCIESREANSKVDLFAGTFTKDGKTYLAVAAIWLW